MYIYLSWNRFQRPQKPSLWFMTHIFRYIFRANSLAWAFQSNLNSIEIYSYCDLFLLQKKEREKNRHMLETCEKIEINIKRKRQMWPQGLNTKHSHWSILTKSPQNRIKIRTEHMEYWFKNQICLYYGIVCHINKRLQIFSWTCSVYTSWFYLISIHATFYHISNIGIFS